MAPAWYSKYTKIILTAMTRARRAPETAPFSCAVLRSKEGPFLICTHVIASKVPAMVREGCRNGCRVLSIGVLYKGKTGLVFGVKKGNTSLKKPMTDAFRNANGGQLVKVQVIALAREKAQTAVASKAFKVRAQRLVARYKDAAPGAQGRAQPLLRMAVLLGKKGRFLDAEKVLDQAEKVLDDDTTSYSP